MVFQWVVRYLNFLKVVPPLSFIFDMFLYLWYALFRPEVMSGIDAVEERVLRWRGVSLRLHRFGGMQFNYGEKEIGHLHSNGLLDVLLNVKTKEKLINKGLACEHHVFKKSGWVSFQIQQKEDYQKALFLLRLSYMLKK